MYDQRPNMIIGFHGCDESKANQLVNDPDTISFSKENYDWLGHGLYFWENNYDRALEWAKQKEAQGKIKKAAVVGAILQLGQCCDFLDTKFIRTISVYHKLMESQYQQAGKKLPENLNAPVDPHNDRLLRMLDCATIEFMHKEITQKYKEDILKTGYSNIKVFDSTRGVFTEGGLAYTGAGIYAKSHIQICIRNFNCIKGFFIPRKEIEFPTPSKTT